MNEMSAAIMLFTWSVGVCAVAECLPAAVTTKEFVGLGLLAFTWPIWLLPMVVFAFRESRRRPKTCVGCGAREFYEHRPGCPRLPERSPTEYPEPLR